MIKDDYHLQSSNKNIMKAKVLTYQHDNGSGYGTIRVYLENDFEQAEKDLDLLIEFGDNSKTFLLIPTEIYNNYKTA